MFSSEYKFPSIIIVYFNGKQIYELSGYRTDEYHPLIDLMLIIANIILKTKHHET